MARQQGNSIKGKPSGRGKVPGSGDFSAGRAKKHSGKNSSGSGYQGKTVSSGSRGQSSFQKNSRNKPSHYDKSPAERGGPVPGGKKISRGSERESGYGGKKTDSFDSGYKRIVPCSETVIGFHAIEEMLKEGNIEGILFISGKGKRHEKIAALALSRNIRIQRVSDELLAAKSPETDPKGVVFEVTGRNEQNKETSLKAFLDKLDKSGAENALVVILDRITDPHNLGAVLRSADQFNADLVILPSRRSAGDNVTVRKISSGASEYVPQAVENLSRAADMLKKNGFWIYAADMDGEPAWDLNLKGKTALVLGSEGEGVSRILTDKSDSIIKIPASGHVDSFNVSVAAGILMYEAVRQQSLSK